MGKQDRYNLDGADDVLEGDSSEPLSEEGERPENENMSPTTSKSSSRAGDAGNTSTTTETSVNSDSAPAATDTGSSQSADIPHRVRYDSPKEARKAKTLYLDQEQDFARLRELRSLAEAEFDEKVHQLDVDLAAFRSDLSDDSFIEEMQQIGYGYFN